MKELISKSLSWVNSMFTLMVLLFSTIFVFYGGSIDAQSLAGVDTCPGGSCSYTYYVFGEPKGGCDACCPTGKSPNCSTFGCVCNVD